MRDVQEFLPLLGPPLRTGGEAELRRLERHWAISLPPDFRAILAAYGDATWDNYFQVCGPRTLGFMGEFFEYVVNWGHHIPFDLLPEPDGPLLWGSTVEGDMLCLEPVGERWRVLIASKVIADVVRHEMDFSNWLYAALTGHIDTTWLPRIDTHPLTIDKYGKLPCGVPTGDGPAGAVIL